jgi:hypothetical protein
MIPRGTLNLLTGLVLLRQLVAFVHGYGHHLLAIPMAMWQHAFILLVIALAPFALLAALWLRRTPAIAWWLIATVAAGSLFGIYFHFGPMNPDHVSTLPDLPGRMLFIVTAALLVAVELAFIWPAALLWRERKRSG